MNEQLSSAPSVVYLADRTLPPAKWRAVPVIKVGANHLVVPFGSGETNLSRWILDWRGCAMGAHLCVYYTAAGRDSVVERLEAGKSDILAGDSLLTYLPDTQYQWEGEGIAAAKAAFKTWKRESGYWEHYGDDDQEGLRGEA